MSSKNNATKTTNIYNNSSLMKIKAVMFGHAVGDALGVPVEFVSRAELDQAPVEEMEGFGTYPYPAGCWSDDTSMSLAAMDSLVDGKINWDEIMLNFGKWYYEDEYTPTEEMFDVGNTCSTAIENYFKHNLPLWKCGLNDEFSNGNGSLMRIHPFALYEYSKGTFNMDVIHNASALTHAHNRSKMACGIYSFVLWELLHHPSKASVVRGLNKAKHFYCGWNEMSAYYKMFFRKIGLTELHFEDPDIFEKAQRNEIKSGGYVVDTIEAAIWCLINTYSYKDCVLTAVNLGDDTDTVAAVAGGLAGALYGYNAIPEEWLNKLKKRDYIEKMCNRASRVWVCYGEKSED